MGILNATPDSFSDGGRHTDPTSAVKRAQELLAGGCFLIDVGGVSTRPGSADVPPEEEWARVGPVLAALRGAFPDALLSLDTSSPTVLEHAAAAGLVDLANDVWAGRKVEPGTAANTAKETPGVGVGVFDVCARHGLPLVVMHMRGEPGTMQVDPRYVDVVEEVVSFLSERAGAAERAGVPLVAVDPGIGFGKRLEHNLALLSAPGLARLGALGYPLLVGLSRKRFLAELEARRPEPRAEIIAFAAARDGLSKTWEWACAERGARILRSHRGPGEVAPEPRAHAPALDDAHPTPMEPEK